MRPERWWYLSDLARHLGVTPSSLQRELSSLVNAGILERRQEGRQVYYRPDQNCPILPELQGIMTKTAGLVDVLQQTLQPFSKLIECAFVYGSIARSEELGDSDIDLMIIGRLGLSDLAPGLNKAERQLGRSINPILYTRNELAKKLHDGNHFLQTALGGEKLFVIGNEDDLAAASSG
jgi:DNA-binding transcriptional ArsR family regulator